MYGICGSAIVLSLLVFFFFNQKTAYEVRISDWSSDVCSSDLFLAKHGAAVMAGGPGANVGLAVGESALSHRAAQKTASELARQEIERASCRERVWQYG